MGDGDGSLKLIGDLLRKTGPVCEGVGGEWSEHTAATTHRRRIAPERHRPINDRIGMSEKIKDLPRDRRHHLQFAQLPLAVRTKVRHYTGSHKMYIGALMSVVGEDVGAPKGIGAQSDTESVDQSRRRWMIGALASPVAVSLPVGASAAAFGSISTCVENTYSRIRIPLHVAVMDKYARTQVSGFVVEKG